jgi:hypothetical protein
MLESLYADALIADEKAADEIWEIWNAGVITDEMAALVWMILALGFESSLCLPEEGNSDEN